VLYTSFLSRVVKSRVQVCLPRRTGQKGMMHLVSAKCDQITCTSMSAFTALVRMER